MSATEHYGDNTAEQQKWMEEYWGIHGDTPDTHQNWQLITPLPPTAEHPTKRRCVVRDGQQEYLWCPPYMVVLVANGKLATVAFHEGDGWAMGYDPSADDRHVSDLHQQIYHNPPGEWADLIRNAVSETNKRWPALGDDWYFSVTLNAARVW